MVGEVHGVGSPTQRFWYAVTNEGRAPCRFAKGYGRCDGPLDAHHLIPKQRIKREFRHDDRLVDLIADPRNGIAVCRRHHDMLEGRKLRMLRVELPAGLEEFAVEVGMVWCLERDFGQVAA